MFGWRMCWKCDIESYSNNTKVEYTFIQNRFHPMTLSSKTLSSNFDTFIQWHFQPRHFHPTTISSNEFLIQWHFHPMTFSTNNGFIQKKITCGTINTVRVFLWRRNVMNFFFPWNAEVLCGSSIIVHVFLHPHFFNKHEYWNMSIANIMSLFTTQNKTFFC